MSDRDTPYRDPLPTQARGIPLPSDTARRAVLAGLPASAPTSEGLGDVMDILAESAGTDGPDAPAGWIQPSLELEFTADHSCPCTEMGPWIQTGTSGRLWVCSRCGRHWLADGQPPPSSAP